MTDFFCEKLNRKMATDECLSYQKAAAGVTTHACYNCEQGLDVATDAALGASPVKMRVCRICGEEKPITDFPKSPSYKDGRETKCKSCTYALRKKSKSYVGKSKSKIEPPQAATPKPEPAKAATVKEKACRVCGEIKPISEFSKHRISNDGHYHICRSCVKDRNKSDRKEMRIIYDGKSVTIDQAVIDAVISIAGTEYRPPLMQAAFILKNAASKELVK